MPYIDAIKISGARQHNLADIDVTIPHNRLTVVTGRSGSGKTSLVYHTLFKEGQRMYAESLSTYLRQFIGQVKKPPVREIAGLSPTVAIRQHHRVTETNRSTVGTATEIYHYLAALYASVGEVVSPHTGATLRAATPHEVWQWVQSQTPRRVIVGVPVDVRLLFAHPQSYLDNLFIQGYRHLWLEGRTIDIEAFAEFAAGLDDLSAAYAPEAWQAALVVIDMPSADDEAAVYEAARRALTETGGCEVVVEAADGTVRRRTFSTRLWDGRKEYLPPSEELFNFNNAYGACPRCEGFGLVVTISEAKVIPDPSLSVRQGAVACWRGERAGRFYHQFIAAAPRFGFRLDVPYARLSEEEKRLLWEGSEAVQGIRDLFRLLEQKTYKAHVRIFRERFIERVTCPECRGFRLRPEALAVKIDGHHIGELSQWEVSELDDWLAARQWSDDQRQKAQQALDELLPRLRMMRAVGLGYLTLDRPMRTLSGGEWQRLQLLKAVRSAMTGITYVLDEPTIGLHPADTERLVGVLRQLATENTVVVVEHDETVIRAADYIIELGPGAGHQGGRVVFEGPAERFESADTLTGRYLRGERAVQRPNRRPLPSSSDEWFEWRGVQRFNLQNIDVRFPQGVLTVISGPSGAGKSTLMQEVMYPSLNDGIRRFYRRRSGPSVEWVDLIDQKSIARSSRSNVMSYIGLYTLIRGLFARTDEARRAGLSAAHFSFNSKEGQCETCKGEGVVYIDLQFLAPIEMTCEECGGRRFKPEVLEVKLHGHTIADIFDMEVRAAAELLADYADLHAHFQALEEVGLSYLKMGQTTASLSGGELHRLKIAHHLLHRQETPGVIFFDEPTVGLHFDDVNVLLRAFDHLLQQGHTLVVIEHHPALIAQADWLIELGPGGGKHGGRLVFQGRPNAKRGGRAKKERIVAGGGIEPPTFGL